MRRKNKGYLLVSFGKEYVDEATNFIRTLRKFNDNYPVSLLCGSEDVDYASSTKLFDKIIIFNFDNEFSKNDQTSFEKYGATPKILMPEYSPYKETIYVDTDVLVQTDTKYVWEYMASLDQPYVVIGSKARINDPIVKAISKKLNKDINEINEIHSGIIYYNRDHKEFKLFLNTLKYFWKNYDEYGLSIRSFREGRADEHAILAAIAKLDYKVAKSYEFPIMTHNYHKDISLPSNIITGGKMYDVEAELHSPIPFIHMFKTYGKEHYDILYTRLINL